ncbi:MAG: hypothetical protein R3F17_11105 [Planctomycetota bacterium]
MPNQNDTEVGAPVNGAGGDGSPGILQIHVDDLASNLRFTGISPDRNLGQRGRVQGHRAAALRLPWPDGCNGRLRLFVASGGPK